MKIVMLGSIDIFFEMYFVLFYLTSHKLLWVYKTVVHLIR